MKWEAIRGGWALYSDAQWMGTIFVEGNYVTGIYRSGRAYQPYPSVEHAKAAIEAALALEGYS